MKFLILFFISLTISLYTKSQQIKDIDSLKNILNKSINDTTRVNLFLNIAKEYEQNNADSMNKYIDTAMLISHKINYKYGIANSFKLKGTNNIYNLSLAKEGIIYADKALQLFKEINDKKNISYCYNMLGTANSKLGHDEKALDLYHKCIEIAKEINDSVRIGTTYNNIGLIYRKTLDFKKAKDYYNNGFRWLEKTNRYDKIVGGMHKMAELLILTGEYDSALNKLEEALIMANDINLIRYKIYITMSMASIHYLSSNYPLSLKKYISSLKYAETYNNPRIICLIHLRIGIIHREQKKYPESIESFQTALQIANNHSLNTELSGILINLARVYLEINSYDLAHEYFLKVLAQTATSDNNVWEIEILRSLGDINQSKRVFTRALNNYNQAFLLATKIDDKKNMSQCLKKMGNIYFKKEQYKNSIKYHTQSLSLAKKLKLKDEISEIYQLLSKNYFWTKNFEKAYKYLELHKTTSDSIFNKESFRLIEEIEAKYQNEKKQKQIELLEAETKIKDLNLKQESDKRKRQYLIFSGALLCLILASSIIYVRKHFKQKALLEQQQKIRFKEVMEAEEKERKRIARDLHDGVGQILSTAKLNLECLDIPDNAIEQEDKNLFANSIKLVNEACVEVRSVSHNLMPGALTKLGFISAIKDLLRNVKNSNKIETELIVESLDERLTESIEIALFRIVQEALSNAVKYAFAKHIKISITKKDNIINMTIEDDGIGLDKSAIRNSIGIGWKNIFSRVDIINGKVNIESKKGKGTSIQIIFST